MPSVFVIRDANADDAAAIASIYAPYVLTTAITFEETPPDAGEMGARVQKVRDSGLFWFVAEAPNGEVVGYAYSSLFHPRSAYRFSVENSVYVDPRHHRRGAGSALMRCLIDACRGADRRQMIALIGDSANQPSLKLHSGLGFQTVGILSNVGFKFGRWIDVAVMQLPL